MMRKMPFIFLAGRNIYGGMSVIFTSCKGIKAWTRKKCG